MDVFLYGVFALEIVDIMHFTNIPFHELARTPFAINLGILGAILLPKLAQSSVRTGLIGLSLSCLLVMTGVIFTSVLFAAIVFVFFSAKLLQKLSIRLGKPLLPLICGWLLVNATYLPLYYYIFPPVIGYMTIGEFFILWGPLFVFFRSLHYIRLACTHRVDPNADKAFHDFLLYMVHFPSFWMGPFQKFQHFTREVATCKQRINRENQIAGLKRIGLGVVKFVILFHVFNVPLFYKLDYFGPFANAFFANADASPGHLWFVMALFVLRMGLFISALSDGVIGMNLLMGIRGPENSNWPIIAKDIRDFWKRWHSQAGSFLRDEVAIVFGNRRNRYIGYFLVFLYCGFFHSPTVYAIVIFPIVQLALFKITDVWGPFWQKRKQQNSLLYQLGGRFISGERWSSYICGMAFIYVVTILTWPLIFDRYHGGSIIIPRMFGF